MSRTHDIYPIGRTLFFIMDMAWTDRHTHHDAGGPRGTGPPYRRRALDRSPHLPDLEVRGGLAPLKGHAGPWDGGWVVTGEDGGDGWLYNIQRTGSWTWTIVMFPTLHSVNVPSARRTPLRYPRPPGSPNLWRRTQCHTDPDA